MVERLVAVVIVCNVFLAHLPVVFSTIFLADNPDVVVPAFFPLFVVFLEQLLKRVCLVVLHILVELFQDLMDKGTHECLNCCYVFFYPVEVP